MFALADPGRESATFPLFYLPINEAGLRDIRDTVAMKSGELRNRGRTRKLAIRQVNSILKNIHFSTYFEHQNVLLCILYYKYKGKIF